MKWRKVELREEALSELREKESVAAPRPTGGARLLKDCLFMSLTIEPPLPVGKDVEKLWSLFLWFAFSRTEGLEPHSHHLLAGWVQIRFLTPLNVDILVWEMKLAGRPTGWLYRLAGLWDKGPGTQWMLSQMLLVSVLSFLPDTSQLLPGALS